MSFIDISLIPSIYWIDVTSASSSVLSKLIPISSHVWSITPDESLWDAISSLALLSSVFSSLILVLNSVSVSFYKVTISFDERLVWTFIRRKVWISYNIITVVCIHIIWFSNVDMWGNSSTSPLLILGKNPPTMFLSRQRKRHDYLFYFCKIVRQYNWNKTWNLIRSSMSWASRIDWSRDECNDWLNCILKIICKKMSSDKCKFIIIP